MIESETMFELPVPTAAAMVTVRSEVAVIPLDSAMTCVYPAPTAVTRPDELTTATLAFVTDQLTELDTFEVLGSPDPIWVCP
jgi:hypothetical protein